MVFLSLVSSHGVYIYRELRSSPALACELAISRSSLEGRRTFLNVSEKRDPVGRLAHAYIYSRSNTRTVMLELNICVGCLMACVLSSEQCLKGEGIKCAVERWENREMEWTDNYAGGC